jgi:hypothetical protein
VGGCVTRFIGISNRGNEFAIIIEILAAVAPVISTPSNCLLFFN